jgi:hypothetical protein
MAVGYLIYIYNCHGANQRVTTCLVLLKELIENQLSKSIPILELYLGQFTNPHFVSALSVRESAQCRLGPYHEEVQVRLKANPW